jgi:hypothetical protein
MFRAVLLASVAFVSLAVSSPQAKAEPVSLTILGSIAIWGAEVGLSTAAITGLVTAASLAISATVNIGIGLAISYAGNKLFGPSPPKPEERQTLFRDGTHSRFRSYGRVKVSGVLAFVTKSAGALYRVIVTGQGEIDAVEEHWVDDVLCPLDGAGEITSGHFSPYINIKYVLGTASQTAYSGLIAAAPGEWTAAHKGNGMPHALMQMYAIKAKNFSSVYPRGEPNYRQVQRAAKVFDPRDVTQTRADPATWKWSDNYALCIMDYLTHDEGMRMPWSFILPELATWIEAANVCDEPVSLAAGGTVKRYLCGLIYDLTERPAQVLQRMLESCDGQLAMGASGGLGLSVGRWIEPTVIIDGDCIIDSEVSRGKNILAAANVIKGRYMSPVHDYQSTEAQEWRDEDDISARGELVRDLDFKPVPNHSQMRRLMKLASYRANPDWTGSVTCNMRAMGVIGSRFVRMVDEENGIDEAVEVLGDPEFVIDQNSVLLGVKFSWASMSANAYAWNAATEEGQAAPVPGDITIDTGVAAMTGLAVAVEQRIVTGGISVAVGVVTWTTPANVGFEPEIQLKLTSGAATTWGPLSIATGQSRTETGVLQDGQSYDVRGRLISPNGVEGAWTAVVTFTATADVTAPPVVTAVSATGSVGVATINWTSPNNVHYIKGRIYRNTINTFGSATFVKDVFGPASTAQSTTDTGLAAGTYYYWVRASNGSNVEATQVATGAVVVT